MTEEAYHPSEVDAKIQWMRADGVADPIGKAKQILADLDGTEYLSRTAALWTAVLRKLESNQPQRRAEAP